MLTLALDIGNTNISIGAFEGKELIKHWRVATDHNKETDEYGILIIQLLSHDLIKPRDINGVVVSSVVPRLLKPICEMSQRYFQVEPLVVSSQLNLGLELRCDNPWEVGTDRIANAVAAHEEYKGKIIVVDFGTSTNFDVVSEDGAYIGGAIAPGISISSEALFQRAAKLPKVEITRPQSVIGKNTIACMQSGFYFGFKGQMEEIIRQIKSELGDEARVRVIATGGFSSLIASDSKLVDTIDPNLTIKGLRIIYDRVRSVKCEV